MSGIRRYNTYYFNNNCNICKYWKADTNERKYEKYVQTHYEKYSPIYNDKYSNDRYLYNQFGIIVYPCGVMDLNVLNALKGRIN